VAEVKLSSTARRDLAGIDAYSAEEFGDKVADKYTRGMNEAFAMLADVPFAGEARPDYGKGVRCKVFKSHRILYRVESDIVFVQRILHHA
jgi:toxin ParE1/3/4